MLPGSFLYIWPHIQSTIGSVESRRRSGVTGYKCLHTFSFTGISRLFSRVVLAIYPLIVASAAAAAKSLKSCPTLCDPIDSNSPGSIVPGILQARVLEWVAIAFSALLQRRSQFWLHVGNCFFDLFLIASVIIIIHNGLLKRTLTLCQAVKLKCFVQNPVHL